MRSVLELLAASVKVLGRARVAVVLLAMLAGTCGAALADPIGPVGLTAIRGGLNVTGVELWTVFQPYKGLEAYRTLDTVEVELVFRPPDASVLQYLGDPSISLGAHISTTGRASLAHLGLTWGTHLFDTPFFIEGTLGGAVTNSTLVASKPPERSVGCPLLFYFAADAGYQFDQHWSIMGSAYHASHANVCNFFNKNAHNDGLNGVGLKIGYNF